MSSLSTYITPVSQAEALLNSVEPASFRIEKLAVALSTCGQAEEHERLKGAAQTMATVRNRAQGIAIKFAIGTLSQPLFSKGETTTTCDTPLEQWSFLARQAAYLTEVAEQAFALDLPSVAAQMLTYSIDSLARIALEADASNEQAHEKKPLKKGINPH